MKNVTSRSIGHLAVSVTLFLLSLIHSSGQYAAGEIVADPPGFSNYYSMAHTNWPPLPFLPGNFTVYSLGQIDGVVALAFDDRTAVEDGKVATKLTEASNPPPAPGSGGGSDYSDFPPAYSNYSTNDLWLELTGITNSEVYLTAHNTEVGEYYQLLAVTNLNETFWGFQKDFYGFGGDMPLDPISQSNRSSTFFRLAGSDTQVGLFAVTNCQEPVPAYNFLGSTGLFTISRLSAPFDFPLTVLYTVTGTASNGVDYTYLPGSVTLPADVLETNISVIPLADYAPEATETVTLTLSSGTNYLPIKGVSSATISIADGPLWIPVATLGTPVGIDYHKPTRSLIVSVNDPSGDPNNFVRIYADVTSANGNLVTNTVVTNWSGVHGAPVEVKLATVKATANGFIEGDTYFANGTKIGWLSADGTSSNLNWCTLGSNQAPRCSLYIDRSGQFGGKLVAVAGGDTFSSATNTIWTVESNGVPNLVTTLAQSHLEGVVTITNDTQMWGPWAGKIITGNENIAAVFQIATNGIIGTNVTDTVRPEDFDLIPPNEDLYCVNYRNNDYGFIVRVAQEYLTNYVGGLLVTDAGEVSPPAKLFVIQWNPVSSNFVTTQFPISVPDQFEHVTFAPIRLPQLTP